MNLIFVVVIVVFLKTTTNAYTSLSNGINNNNLDARNSTLSRTTSRPPTNRFLLRFSLPQDDLDDYENKEDDYDYADATEDPEPQGQDNLSQFLHKRVPREQTSRYHARSLNEKFRSQVGDNHLRFPADDEQSDDYQSDQQPGVLTRFKTQMLGTQRDVEEFRERTYNSTRNAQLNRLAAEHLRMMATEGICREPRQEVTYITRETNTMYSPRATILNRCSDLNGCCDVGFTCQAKEKEWVQRVFTVRIGNYSQTKVLEMENHTLCGCVKVGMRRKRSPNCQCPKHFIDFSWKGSHPETVGQMERDRVASRCRCDCHLSDFTCKRLKNGEEGFSVMERLRIQNGDSSPPFCNYGPYDMKNGRCPRPGLPNGNMNLKKQFQPRRQHGQS
ncbi:uncharacterized protein LOC108100122 [Drosophila ficusphila]|uniref:uncharacterized protein LOC108100122 n=1 Tax=Drosophila ficusphila TaxID=30025 RepID=UPI0007E836C1|nr:uncharacterized protein LOC108100122 [Drosophila ficusphila]